MVVAMIALFVGLGSAMMAQVAVSVFNMSQFWQDRLVGLVFVVSMLVSAPIIASHFGL